MMELYRFDFSPFARKVQMLLDLLGLPYTLQEVPYGDREALARLTGGYIQVPVLRLESGRMIKDSRVITEELLKVFPDEKVMPAAWQGPIWAYADWCDQVLEDTLFRLASPGIRRRFINPWERALFTFIRERKFGSGCIDQWQAQQEALLEQARSRLQPTLRTLNAQPFLFGEVATLADAALYGQFAMLEIADPGLPAAVSPVLALWMRRMEAGKRISRHQEAAGGSTLQKTIG